ncbi:MAG: hypothetical protein FJ218_01270 [Ignavibacteria bacterium]|nr:hypothetical protein [Ignavibacteria bacterium]
MNTITIPKKFIQNDELVILPRKKYEEFIALEKYAQQLRREEADTDKAIEVYKKEKRLGKLQTISSLEELE